MGYGGIDFNPQPQGGNPLDLLTQGANLGLGLQRGQLLQQENARQQQEQKLKIEQQEILKAERRNKDFNEGLSLMKDRKFRDNFPAELKNQVLRGKIAPYLTQDLGLPVDENITFKDVESVLDQGIGILESKASTEMKREAMAKLFLRADDSERKQLKEAGDMAFKDSEPNGISPSLLYQMQKDQEKKAMDEKSREIPGYSRVGSVLPDDIEVRKLREAAPEFKTFQSTIKDYQALIKKYGTQELTDREVQGKMEAMAKNLQLKVKNLAQLGVLSASDIPFIEEQIPSPGVFKSKQGMLGALQTAESMLEIAVNNKMQAGGYKAIADAGNGELIEDGYRFLGGDKSDPANWEKVK